jgi:hypothetical protein
MSNRRNKGGIDAQTPIPMHHGNGKNLGRPLRDFSQPQADYLPGSPSGGEFTTPDTKGMDYGGGSKNWQK